MIAHADDLAATARPLQLVRRSDIESEAVSLGHRKCWRLKDPVALRFWQLGDEEYFLWSQLEGSVSLADLGRRFRDRFAPRHIDIAHLHQFLGALHADGLIVSRSAGQGDVLLTRHNQRRLRDRWKWANLLALRFRGIDPARWLDSTYPLIAWMFRPSALVAFATLVLSALLLVLVQLPHFLERLPQAANFVTPQNLIWLVLVLAVTKVFHELGHAYTCHHLGGRCHELGLMLLVFTPCLYCNVSDAWMIPSRWGRMAISAAGMGVELVLAAAATWLWWFSEPGLFSLICLNVMVVGSVNTLFLNGNPLLRYDGYFLLSDLMDLPNLRQSADEWLHERIDRYWLGIESGNFQSLREDRSILIGGYSVLAFVYRWVMTGLIWWLVYHWFRNLNMASIGIGVIVLSAALLLGHASWSRWQRASAAWRERRVKMGRAATSLVVTMALLAVLGFLPLPRQLSAPSVVRPADAATVYVSRPGTLVRAMRPGSVVQAGDVIAEFEDEDLEQEIVKLSSDLDVLHLQSENLGRLQIQQPAASGLIGRSGELLTLEQQMAALADRLQQKRLDRERLTLRALRSGIILSPRSLQPRSTDDLTAWDGTPLEERNVKSFVEAGTVVGQIGNPERYEVLLAVEQSQIDSVQVGQSVTVQLDELPDQCLIGSVSGIAELHSDGGFPELIAKRMLPTSQEMGGQQLLGNYYQVTVALEQGPRVPFGASGRAKIRVPSQPVFVRIYNAVCATIRG